MNIKYVSTGILLLISSIRASQVIVTVTEWEIVTVTANPASPVAPMAEEETSAGQVYAQQALHSTADDEAHILGSEGDPDGSELSIFEEDPASITDQHSSSLLRMAAMTPTVSASNNALGIKVSGFNLVITLIGALFISALLA